MGALIVLVMLLSKRLSSDTGGMLERMIRRLLCCCLAVFISDILGLMLDGHSFRGARLTLWLLDTGYWIFHVVYCWLWLIFTDMWCVRSAQRAKRMAGLYAVPMYCGLLIILSNPWTGWLFTLTAENVYMPGTAYQLCLSPCYAYIAASLLTTAYWALRSEDAEQKRRCLSFFSYMLLPVFGVAMELLAYGTSWTWPASALSLLMVYLNMQQQSILDERLSTAKAAENAAIMQAEATNSRMAIMLSQIQPHFLYNALCVIQDLCHDKAPEAEQATIAFSRFLRGNLDSLNAVRPIPFSQELGHTRYYLTLEQMRFGSRLNVEYELETEQFTLPAMTLQPIVENAVRYGLMKREEGGTVRISSMETESRYVVTVEDDGVGFCPNAKHTDGRTHIGIENVRQRLRDMCSGELKIVSIPGSGTIATIALPKEVCKREDTGG